MLHRLGAVMLMEVEAGREHLYGVVAGEFDSTGVMRIREMVEKPKPGTAPSRWSIVGRYVLPPAIWDMPVSYTHLTLPTSDLV